MIRKECARLTFTAAGSGEITQFHHPDLLGTRLVSKAADTNVVEQATLPFGTALANESTGASNRRFTSYDRSAVTGLDYAVNRHYDSQQGRFTQVDPIGMGAASLADPQSLNLFSYCANDPVNRLDPSGLFWGKLFKWIGKALKWIGIAVGIAMIVIGLVVFPGSGQALWFMAKYFMMAGGLIASGLGAGKVSQILGVFVQGAGIYLKTPGIIVNFLPGASSSGSGGPTWGVGVGPIVNFFQQSGPDKYIPQKNKADFNKVVTEATTRVGEDKCARLFGKSSAELIAIINKTQYRYLPLSQGGPIYADGKVTVVGAQTNPDGSVFFNSKGPFFNNRMFVPGAPRNPVLLDFGSGLIGKEFGALLLLHELGHQVGIFGPDAGNEALNRAYTRRVLDACF